MAEDGLNGFVEFRGELAVIIENPGLLIKGVHLRAIFPPQREKHLEGSDQSLVRVKRWNKIDLHAKVGNGVRHTEDSVFTPHPSRKKDRFRVEVLTASLQVSV